MEIPAQRILQFSDPAQQQKLSASLSKRLQEAVNTPGTDVVIERHDHKTTRMSLQDYLQRSNGSLASGEKTFVVIESSEGQLAVDLKFLSKRNLLQALEKLENAPQKPPSAELLKAMDAIRQQVLGGIPASSREWDLRQEYPDYKNLDSLKSDEDKWPAASLTEAMSLEAFTDLLNVVPGESGQTTYAVPPSLLEGIHAQLGEGIKTWQQLKFALLELGLPEKQIHKLYKQEVIPFLNTLHISQPVLPPVASFQDLDLDRSELFQSLWQPGGMSLDTFTDLIAGEPLDNGEKTLELPPETCKKLYQGLGKTLRSWDQLANALKDLGVAETRVKALYQHQVTQFVQKQQIPANSVLFLANADPNDLSMDKEASLIRQEFGAANVIVIKRPTLQEMEALVQSGRFSRVWVAGHGTPQQTVMTNANGSPMSVDHQDVVKALSSHSAVRMVMGSICWSAYGGEDASLVGQLARKGIAAVGYESSVKDGYAIQMSQKVAKGLRQNQTLTPIVSQAYQSAEKDYYVTDVVHLRYQPGDRESRQAYTTELFVQRFRNAAYYPEEAEHQELLKDTAKRYPALQPLQDFLQAYQRRDLAGIKRLIGQNPQLKSILNAPEIKPYLLGLQQSQPGAPLLVKPQKDDSPALKPPASADQLETFHADLAASTARKYVSQLLAAGQMPIFANGKVCPQQNSRTAHAQAIADSVVSHTDRAIENPDQATSAASLRILIDEYPGVTEVLGLIKALSQGDNAGQERILAQHPDLQELSRGLQAEWQAHGPLSAKETQSFLGHLRMDAIRFYVAQQYLEHKKSFVQLDKQQNLPL